ncbi:hypothetical protein AB1Y20_019991 [Prymnesium parvum]|uniref:F5/8 type C domain-containing protein n=1 Tax=Prymnesium parvum TaxID=97485 RepID=A0AB34JSC8_PRYPA
MSLSLRPIIINPIIIPGFQSPTVTSTGSSIFDRCTTGSGGSLSPGRRLSESCEQGWYGYSAADVTAGNAYAIVDLQTSVVLSGVVELTAKSSNRPYGIQLSQANTATATSWTTVASFFFTQVGMRAQEAVCVYTSARVCPEAAKPMLA